MYDKFIKEIDFLSDFDIKILDIIFKSPLPYLDILWKQLCVATIKVENLVTSYVLDFHIELPVDRIPTSKIVPVSIDICPHIELFFKDTKISNYYKKTGTVHLLETSDIFFVPQDDKFYEGINMYFKDGRIQEIEIVNWAGFPIDCCRNGLDIDKWKKIFRYNDKQWFDMVIDKEHLK